jgi:hypothetical protein
MNDYMTERRYCSSSRFAHPWHHPGESAYWSEEVEYTEDWFGYVPTLYWQHFRGYDDAVVQEVQLVELFIYLFMMVLVNNDLFLAASVLGANPKPQTQSTSQQSQDYHANNNR